MAGGDQEEGKTPDQRSQQSRAWHSMREKVATWKSVIIVVALHQTALKVMEDSPLQRTESHDGY